jgi:hypothetical protein
MRAVLMVVANILRERSLEMAFIHRDNVVQQVSSTAFDPRLRHTVCQGLSKDVRTGLIFRDRERPPESSNPYFASRSMRRRSWLILAR